jgi:hypothetical protein
MKNGGREYHRVFPTKLYTVNNVHSRSATEDGGVSGEQASLASRTDGCCVPPKIESRVLERSPCSERDAVSEA